MSLEVTVGPPRLSISQGYAEGVPVDELAAQFEMEGPDPIWGHLINNAVGAAG